VNQKALELVYLQTLVGIQLVAELELVPEQGMVPTNQKQVQGPVYQK
jgi:hypothetical protein